MYRLVVAHCEVLMHFCFANNYLAIWRGEIQIQQLLMGQFGPNSVRSVASLIKSHKLKYFPA